MSTQSMLQKKNQKYLRLFHNLFITNKLSLQLGASTQAFALNCDKFTVITVLQ